MSGSICVSPAPNRALASRLAAARPTRPRVPVLCATAALCLATALGACSTASGASITVNLRVEGSATTLFEGPITTSAETIETPASNGPHPCNYASNGPAEGFENGGNQSGTPTTALHDAALASGLPFNAEWFGSGTAKTGSPGDFFVTQVGSDVNETTAPFDSWGYAVNFTTAPVGGCQIALAPGSEVLWAYNYFNLPHLLSLSGPTSANVGVPVTVHVVDGQTGEPIAGAAIGEVVEGMTSTIPGSPTTDAGGNATILLTHAGAVMLKATRSDSVRSNGLVMCIHNGDDGTCGAGGPSGLSAQAGGGVSGFKLSSSGAAVSARVLRIKSGHVYASGRAPRVLAGTVEVPAGDTLHQVRIRLERRVGNRCFDFSGTRETFVRAHYCGTASFFSVGDTESFSYLLPAPLAAGRYTFDIEAVENDGYVTKLSSGVSHVVFRVK